jgi:peptidoglycan-associated lipoprotein
MKRKTVGFLMAVSCGALLAGGCAKQEVIKTDEPLAPSAVVSPPTKAQPQQEQAKKPAYQSPPAQEVIKETPVAKDAAIETNQAGELKVELEKVYFNFDSSNLSEQARASLVKDADLLKKIGKAKIRVEGNCDEKGSDDYNLALGEKRAKEAVQYLVNLGIPAERLTAISYGKEKPANPGHDEASWAKNRRDDLVVTN